MKTNNIVWNNHTPVSIRFDDVYFSHDNALAETEHVFIIGNNLQQRFLSHTQPVFTIGETGFGSGLNFLVAWQQFQLFKQRYPTHCLNKLHFISVEKYPLLPAELQLIHQTVIHDPYLTHLAKQLAISWPKQNYQFVDVTLQVLFADISQFAQRLTLLNVSVDAWFLDGFSPAKNPAMWSAELFSALYQLTAQQGTFATFTSAGQVRRNLSAAGFRVLKTKGFGKKREMLIGYKS